MGEFGLLGCIVENGVMSLRFMFDVFVVKFDDKFLKYFNLIDWGGK